jgi:nitric oxide reductase NorD protein
MSDERRRRPEAEMSPDTVPQWMRRLSAVSGECAEAFRAASHRVAPLLGPEAFERWAAQGLALAQGGWRAWECAAWYFKLSPPLLGRLAPDDFAQLTALLRQALAASPQLGIALLRGAARFVERPRPLSLAAWAAAGMELASAGRSGRVAGAYFEHSPDVLTLTGAGAFRHWLELVQTLAPSAEAAALEFIRRRGQRLDALPSSARPQALQLARTRARQAPGAADDLLEPLAGALRAVSAGLQDRMLEVVQQLAAAPLHLERLLKAAARLLPGLPDAVQERLLRQLLGVARLDGEAGALLCERLPEVLRQLTVHDVETWVGRGIAVLRENREAGLAYFGLESQACQAQLTALSRLVHLPRVQGVLRLYASALAGTALGVRSLAELPPAFHGRLRRFPTTDGETVYLPPSVDRFPTRAENFRLYVVMTAHQAGYLEFGTFRFALAEFVERCGAVSLPRDPSASSPGPAVFRSDFERFFAAFPRPAVARDIFYCLEDGRIDYRLRHSYRGLAPHLERIVAEALAARPPLAGRPLWEAVLEILIHLCSAGRVPGRLPRPLAPLASVLHGVVSSLHQPQATVYDAARGTVEVYRLLEQLPNVRLDAEAELATEGDVLALAEALSPQAALEACRALLPAGEEVAYQSPEPLSHQGELQPELIQRKLRIKELGDALERSARAPMPIPPALLRELLERGAELDIRGTSAAALDDTAGLFVSDLEGKAPLDRVEPARAQLPPEPERVRAQLAAELQQLAGGEVVYRYDEWDYLMRDYRVRWCLLREKAVEGDGEGFVAHVLQEHAALVRRLRRQFQLLKPELFKKLKRRDHGDDIDLDAAIEELVDRRVTGAAPERVYLKRDKRQREVATAFLLDLSASTDDPIAPAAPRQPRSGFATDDGDALPPAMAGSRRRSKRIIDVEREALVVMAEALAALGDEYAIYGFSGYGRENVEFFIVKEADEPYSEAVKRRIDALKPQRSTRMGPAIRHAAEKLRRRPARLKTLLLLSDGYPQDFDYGKDRRGKDYGIQDTKVALQEARRKGLHTFCITVDREGKSYLPEMCGADQFIVIDDVARLPQLLPRIYRRLTT